MSLERWSVSAREVRDLHRYWPRLLIQKKRQLSQRSDMLYFSLITPYINNPSSGESAVSNRSGCNRSMLPVKKPRHGIMHQRLQRIGIPPVVLPSGTCTGRCQNTLSFNRSNRAQYLFIITYSCILLGFRHIQRFHVRRFFG